MGQLSPAIKGPRSKNSTITSESPAEGFAVVPESLTRVTDNASEALGCGRRSPRHNQFRRMVLWDNLRAELDPTAFLYEGPSRGLVLSRVALQYDFHGPPSFSEVLIYNDHVQKQAPVDEACSYHD